MSVHTKDESLQNLVSNGYEKMLQEIVLPFTKFMPTFVKPKMRHNVPLGEAWCQLSITPIPCSLNELF